MNLATNVLLAILWAALIGPFTPTNLLAGFVVGFAVLFICGMGRQRSPYIRRALACCSLALFTLYALVDANIRVAYYTVSRLRDLRPAVLAVPLAKDITDGEITLLSTLITLTPGTLTIDVSDDRKSLYVHFMHVENANEAIQSVVRGFERRVLEVTR